MYYEARTYTRRRVLGPIEAAQIIKSDQRRDYHAYWWEVDAGTPHERSIYIVDDSSIDNPFLEVAVIEERMGIWRQVESITAGWVDSPESLAKYFDMAVLAPTDMGEAQLSLHQADDISHQPTPVL